MARAHGVLEDETVVVHDHGQASRLADKGSYGHRHRGELSLDLMEAAYLVEEDRLKVIDRHSEPVDLAGLISRGAANVEGFETSYLAYRDYRSRGYVLRRGDHGDFDGWARGTAPPRQKPSTLLTPRAEGAMASPSDLGGAIELSRGLGRELLLSVVDEESDVTYYELGEAQVAGHLPDPAPEAAPRARATLLRDRALLLEGPGLVEAGYGNLAGDQRFLSLAETAHLARHGLALKTPAGQSMDADAVVERMEALHPSGGLVAQAYQWVRSLDLVPKTGLKFGVHFRVYQGEPGAAHAPFLVQAMPDDARWTYRDVARLVRLAHSVKKRAIVWSPGRALTLAWTRP